MPPQQETPPSNPGLLSHPGGNGNGIKNAVPDRRALLLAILTGCVGILSYVASQALLPVLHGDVLSGIGVGAVAIIAILCAWWLFRGPKRAKATGDRRKDPTLRADLIILASIGFLAMVTVSTMQVQLYRQNQMAGRILRQQLINENSLLANQQGILQNQAQSRINEGLINKALAQSLENEHLIRSENKANAQARLIATADSAALLATLSSYVDPSGTYRKAIDAALCAELRDVRAVAGKVHVPLTDLLAPPGTRTYVYIGGCRVAVLK